MLKHTTRSFAKNMVPAIKLAAEELRKERGIKPNDKNTLETCVLKFLESKGIHFVPEAEQ